MVIARLHFLGGKVFDGYAELLPIQGGIVAAVFLVISVYQILKGAAGPRAIKWNVIGVISLLYLFTIGAWFAFGQPG